MKKYKIPVILYESEEQVIPYVEVSKDDEMPPTLFIHEYKQTGTYEPDDEGEEREIVEAVIHMFVDMDFLSKKLGAKLYDKVRVSIGLLPVKKARKEGEKVLDKVYEKTNKNIENALSTKEQRKNNAREKLNEKLTSKFFNEEKATEEKGN